jgi:hypothetical protein
MNRFRVISFGILAACVVAALLFPASAGWQRSGEKSAQSAAREFFVSTSGNDSGSGTKSAPFATLARAQQSVRGIPSQNRGGIIIWVRGGTYYLDRTLVLTAEDSASAEAPVVYAAFPQEMVTLSGGLTAAGGPARTASGL